MKRLGRPPMNEVAEGERRSQILKTAIELFGRRGYAAVSISDIAKEVGITKSALYHHFAGKDALYTAVVCHVFSRIAYGVLEIGNEPGPTRDKIHRLVETALLRVPVDADMDSLMRDACEHLSPAQKEQVSQAYSALLNALQALIRKGIERGEMHGQDPRLLAYAFLQLLSSFGGRKGKNLGFQPTPALVETVTNLFLYGTANPPQQV